MGRDQGHLSYRRSGGFGTNAGHDLPLVCHNLENQKEVFHHLLEAYRSKRLPLKELEESAARINKLKLKREKRFARGEPAAEKEGMLLAAGICRESVKSSE